MLGLTDNQLMTVMDMTGTLPVEKRDLYLQRIAAMLTKRGRGHVTDADVADVAQLALTGLAHQPLKLELLAAVPAIQNNNPDHGCDQQRATKS